MKFFRQISFKSFFLGIGLGMILVSFISMIYLAGYSKTEMSTEQIIREAKRLGLVEPSDLIQQNSSSDSEKDQRPPNNSH